VSYRYSSTFNIPVRVSQVSKAKPQNADIRMEILATVWQYRNGFRHRCQGGTANLFSSLEDNPFAFTWRVPLACDARMRCLRAYPLTAHDPIDMIALIMFYIYEL
jgi:hypothetical protein